MPRKFSVESNVEFEGHQLTSPGEMIRGIRSVGIVGIVGMSGMAL